MNDYEVLVKYVKSFSRKSDAAKALDLSLQHLSNLLAKRAGIGNVVREKMQKAGAYVVQQTTEPAGTVKKLTDERDVYIRVLEIENRALKEKVETYEAYLTVKAK